jgi:curved DNA-binding protein CbpA
MIGRYLTSAEKNALVPHQTAPNGRRSATNTNTNKNDPMFQCSPYDILDLPESATPEMIKSRYRFLILRFHPDKISAEDRKYVSPNYFEKIKEAYDFLVKMGRAPEYKLEYQEHVLNQDKSLEEILSQQQRMSKTEFDEAFTRTKQEEQQNIQHKREVSYEEFNHNPSTTKTNYTPDDFKPKPNTRPKETLNDSNTPSTGQQLVQYSVASSGVPTYSLVDNTGNSFMFTGKRSFGGSDLGDAFRNEVLTTRDLNPEIERLKTISVNRDYQERRSQLNTLQYVCDPVLRR